MRKAKQPAQPELLRVRNTREGSISVMPYGGLELPPGVSLHEPAVFKSLPGPVLDALKDFVAEGVLVFGADPEPEPEPAAAPVEVKLPDNFQALPSDDALALVAVAAETSSAVLDAWFQRTEGRPEVSDAILKRSTELDK
jgi:hypothetical protein